MKSLLAGSYLLILVAFALCALRGQPRISPEVRRHRGTFDAARAIDHAERIDALTRASGGRAAGTVGNRLVREYVAGEMSRAGLPVRVEPSMDALGGSLMNVIGAVPGESSEAVLVCAHHDAGESGSAAVQGTAGLAILLELARGASAAVRTRGRPHRALVFASWDGEAFGSAGASSFAAGLSDERRATLRAVLSLDALGWRRGTTVLHVMPYRDRFGVVAVAPDWLVVRASNAARARGVRLPVSDPWLGVVDQIVARSVEIGDYSDDRPFVARGIPAAFLSDNSLMRSYPQIGSPSDTIDQIGVGRLDAVGRAVEAALADLTSEEALPSGESDYLVVSPPFMDCFRITADEARLLGFLCLLPGGIVLIRRRRDGGLVVTRTLFFAFAALFIAGAAARPILFPALFAFTLIAAPVLAIPSLRSVWVYLASLLPALLFAALVAPVYLTGSAKLVRLTTMDLALFSGLVTIALVQAPLHVARARHARLVGARWAFHPHGPAARAHATGASGARSTASIP